MNTTSDTTGAPRSGGCHPDCGRIRFEAKGDPDYPHTCSCRDCKKRGGAPMMSWVAFPLDGFEWTGEGGEPTWYDTYPGKTRRGFCGRCGTHVAAYDYGDAWMGVNIPALDEPDGEGLTPVNQSCRGEAVPWLGQVADTQHSTVG